MSTLNCCLTINQGTERGMHTYTTGQSQLFWFDLICVCIASERHLAHLSDLAWALLCQVTTDRCGDNVVRLQFELHDDHMHCVR